ncbi:putative zinc-binding metallopeptidase [Porphyromonas macacae]|uniref:putative zinc-binding metallopeptidase n=1 Tax=Porphyromonas macacae TaxID=28115 RepID=UPI001C49A796|nr:putative zinc-binding metallopeptidase [Porphyromonas macacae]
MVSATASNEMFAFDVNTFDPSDKKNVYRLMRSLHHHSARRLSSIFLISGCFPFDQSKAYGALPLAPSPADVYRRVGLSPYAHRRGFYTLYSMACRRMSLQRLSVRCSCIRL